ncbi:hypothetical protein A1O7_09483 [Cladophialophora yegresii CBS 114405]|uniref:INO80 complex subunit B-like conserved region domain-containing protein n=1 Tax=Cladophialophora yegresii CBS 114405 TaxID=1182544 RepID=W9VPS9_9EURO|nr:uncharacterized protein A1O7_09483 [Cladophialophora yegresii CBS 114405]EXJ54146.1 hypothetical protein A1O7_09483 [Cladophialophora yegresii CBS 114405]
MAFVTLYYRTKHKTRANHVSRSSAGSTPAASRPRRSGASGSANNVSSATVQRGSGTSEDRRQSLKLTVKAPPSKLREVMRANEVESLHDTLGGGKVLDGPRSSRRSTLAARTPTQPRSKYAEYGESDIEDEDEEEDEEDDEDDADEEEPSGTRNDFDELGAEPEGDTDGEDVEMEDAPPVRPSKRTPVAKAPKITLKPPALVDSKQSAKPKLIVTPAKVGPVKSVEDQEMEDDPDDDEVDESSDLSDEDDEEQTNLNDEDAEGEEEEVALDQDAPAEDEELGAELEDGDDADDLDDSSDETPGSGSATPDLSRMTKRQRGRPEDQGTLMALDMAPQQRKFFTDAEKAMKKDEHARKRKELTKRKVQEEKTAALNRLLKPQVSKTRGAAPKPETLAAAAAAAAVGSPYEEEDIYLRANPLYTRWVSTKDGVKLGVPEEWLGKKVGRYFGPPLSSSNGSLVQEVE